MVDVDDGSGALFVPDGDDFLPTPFTEGPWDPNAQFGGAPSALLAAVVERVPTLVPMQISRLTVDLLRPVPLSPLRPTWRIVREGRRIQVVDASLWSEGVEVARCSALRLRLVDLGGLDLPAGEAGTRLPERPRPADQEPFTGRRPPGSRQAVEYLHQGVGGYFGDPMWVRLRVAVVAGWPVSPVAKLAYVADLASGIGNRPDLPLQGINADLSLNVVRYPSDDWICLRGDGWTSAAGIGQVQATLSDTAGVLAGVSMVRLVDRLPEGSPPRWPAPSPVPFP